MYRLLMMGRPPKHWTRRQRFVMLLNNLVTSWDEQVPHTAPDWCYAPDWGVISKCCKLLRAHCPTNDQCGRPDHRYCMACNRATPYAEPLKWS